MANVTSRIMRLRAAAAGIAIITSGLVLSVADNAHAQIKIHAPQITHTATVKPRFDILCGGPYICIQTKQITDPTASVNAWANTTSFTGHFELLNGCDQFVANGPIKTDRLFPAGSNPYTFTNIHWADCQDSWTIIAWKEAGGGRYTDVGSVNFSI
jgi:hypothetical protein